MIEYSNLPGLNAFTVSNFHLGCRNPHLSYSSKVVLGGCYVSSPRDVAASFGLSCCDWGHLKHQNHLLRGHCRSFEDEVRAAKSNMFDISLKCRFIHIINYLNS